MPSKYDYDPCLNILHARPYGSITVDEALNYFRTVLGDRSIRNGIIEVVHFDQVENFLLSSKHVSRIAELYYDFKVKKSVIATIFIGVKPLHFGMARMMQSFFEMNVLEHSVYSVDNNQELDELIEKIIN